jgi:hypothetical protein
LFNTPTTSEQAQSRRIGERFPYALLWLLAFALAVLTLWLYVDKSPPPLYFDEQFSSSWGYRIFLTGDPLSKNMFDLSSPSVNISYGLWVLGAWLSAFGIDFVTARLWVFALGMVAFGFAFAPRWHTLSQLARLVLASVAFLLLFAQAYIRYDALALPLLAIAVWAHERAKGRWAWYALSGYFFAMMVEGHHLGIRLALAVGAWHTLAYAWQVWRGRGWRFAPFWGLLAGGLAYGATYIVLRLLSFGVDLPTMLELNNYTFVREAMIGGSLSVSERVLANGEALLAYLLATSPLETAVVLAYGALAVWHKDGRALMWTWVYWVGFLLFLPLNPKPHNAPFYMIHAFALVVFMLSELLHALTLGLGKRAVLALGVLACLWGGAIVAELGARGEIKQMVDNGYRINAHLPADVQAVISTEVYFWGLGRRTFYLSSNFIKLDVRDLVREKGLPLPDVVVRTVGLDDMHENITRYIQEAGMVRVMCLPLSVFGRRTEVYALPSLNIPQVDTCP